MATRTKSTDLATLRPDGQIELAPHPGQWRAWTSEKRFIFITAGTQSGKTSFGPHWLYREIQRRGPGDYLVATPTFKLLDRKAMPEFLRLFDKWLALGTYHRSGTRQYVFSPDGDRRTHGYAEPDQPTTVYFGYADDPESLEAMTAKAAWCDEAGQRRFRHGSWEAIVRRLSIHQGRVLATTTLYNLGWLKSVVYDKWRAGDPDFDVIRFDSIENPAFSREEFERARATMPRWRFNMQYRGMFERPAGMIYEAFDPDRHKVKRFGIPPNWPRYLGLDFGGVNTAGVFIAREPNTRRHYVYREYHEGGRTALHHSYHLLLGEPSIPQAFGGSKSEEQWRREFRAGGRLQLDGTTVVVPGLSVADPDVSEIEVGIDRVSAGFAADELFVFDDLNGLLDELGSYSRVLDEQGRPTEKIEDKETFHRADALRYVGSRLFAPRAATRISSGGPSPQLDGSLAWNPAGR